MRAAFVAIAAALGLAAPAGAAPTAGELARACTDAPAGTPFPEGAVLRAGRFARCAVREVREAAGLPRGRDPRLTRAARRALAAAVAGEGRAAVTAALVHAACPAGRVPAVRWSGTDTGAGGRGRTPLRLARLVLAERHVRRHGAVVAVVSREGGFLREAPDGAVAVLLVSATCRPPR